MLGVTTTISTYTLLLWHMVSTGGKSLAGSFLVLLLQLEFTFLEVVGVPGTPVSLELALGVSLFFFPFAFLDMAWHPKAQCATMTETVVQTNRHLLWLWGPSTHLHLGSTRPQHAKPHWTWS